MTEVDILRVDLQLGLLGAVRFLDSAPHAIRRLEMLHPQVRARRRRARQGRAGTPSRPRSLPRVYFPHFPPRCFPLLYPTR